MSLISQNLQMPDLLNKCRVFGKSEARDDDAHTQSKPFKVKFNQRSTTLLSFPTQPFSKTAFHSRWTLKMTLRNSNEVHYSRVPKLYF